MANSAAAVPQLLERCYCRPSLAASGCGELGLLRLTAATLQRLAAATTTWSKGENYASRFSTVFTRFMVRLFTVFHGLLPFSPEIELCFQKNFSAAT
jgi:hypothetical protein